MRIARYFAVLSTSLLIVAGHSIVHAQAANVGTSGPGEPAWLYRSPHTLTFKSTMVQRLANGETITREIIIHSGRDSRGRTYQHSQSGPDTWRTDISDPASNTTAEWDSGEKVVTITHWNRPDKPPPSAKTSTPRNQPHAAPPPITQEQTDKPQIEELGTRTILGLTVKGERITLTIPAESVGNDLPFTVVHEWWYSPDLGMNLIEIEDDQGRGTVTNEVVDFQRIEPDASLFQIPEGYTVTDF